MFTVYIWRAVGSCSSQWEWSMGSPWEASIMRDWWWAEL